MQIEKKMEYNLKNFQIQINEIEEEARVKRVDLARKFAEGNNPYKVGDIITDGSDTLLIKGWRLHLGFRNELPIMAYYGTELKKDGTPKIRQNGVYIYQSRLVKKDEI